jgi:hypothetical protein
LAIVLDLETEVKRSVSRIAYVPSGSNRIGGGGERGGERGGGGGGGEEEEEAEEEALSV